MNLELQQRAVEYNSIFKKDYDLRTKVFESMPEFEIKNNSMDNQIEDDNNQNQNQQHDTNEAFKPLNTLDVTNQDNHPSPFST